MPYQYHDKLQTPRLVTNFLSMNDAVAWAAFFAHPEAIRFLFIETLGLPTKEAVAHHMIQKQLERYAEHRYGLQKLVHRETGEFIGCCGLLLQEVDGQNEIEVGYHIFPAFWNQGYATEAAKCFIDFAFNTHQTQRVISIIDDENQASIRVAEKNGMRLLKRTTWTYDEPVGVFGIFHPQSFQ